MRNRQEEIVTGSVSDVFFGVGPNEVRRLFSESFGPLKPVGFVASGFVARRRTSSVQGTNWVTVMNLWELDLILNRMLDLDYFHFQASIFNIEAWSGSRNLALD